MKIMLKFDLKSVALGVGAFLLLLAGYPAAYAEDGSLLIGSIVDFPGEVLRYDATTGEFIDVFVPPGSGGNFGACCPVFGPDENLYLSSILGHSVLRYNGATGEFIDEFVPAESGGLFIPIVAVFGPDGNLYVGSVGNNSILRYDGSSGDFIDAFVPSGSGGLVGPRVFVFKPKITICHRPPGDPNKSKTLSIGQLSGSDHIAHGDSVGDCQ